MKISVVVIAHNEEMHIEKCLQSLMNQTVKADEIILVAHNCTDKTVEKASLFPVDIKILKGEKGISFARYHGVYNATGDKILCIDGDAVASNNWVESLSELLDESKSMMAGTYVKFKGNLFWSVTNPIIYLSSFVQKNKYVLWGPSFGFTRKMKSLVLNCMKEFPVIHNQLGLSYYPDDIWMNLNANTINPLIFTHKATVVAISKQNSLGAIFRIPANIKNTIVLERYFKKQLSI